MKPYTFIIRILQSSLVFHLKVNKLNSFFGWIMKIRFFFQMTLGSDKQTQKLNLQLGFESESSKKTNFLVVQKLVFPSCVFSHKKEIRVNLISISDLYVSNGSDLYLCYANSGIFQSTFLQPVKGSKNSILNWVMMSSSFNFAFVFL